VRVFGEEGASLLKVGVALMALAVGLVIAAVVVSVALRSEPERVVAADVAAKSLDHPLRYSSGEEGSAARKSSSEKEEPPPYPSGEEEPLGYGPSSSGEPVGQREEEAKEPQAVAGTSEPEPPESQAAMPQPAGRQTTSEAHSEPEPSEPESQPQQHQPQPEEVQSQPEQQLLPGEGSGWPAPTPQELENANSPRHYGGLVDGAIMALTIEDIGIYNAPVYDSDSYWALANGIGHNPQTSLPWSSTPQRNVYLSGHRMGFRGTWSRMIFYNLDKLGKGERVVLEDREGRTYEYEVSEVFLAEPTDVWVMGQVRGRDMVTLQTCTPIPTFEKRLIVRADRV
jgi:sortase A